MDSSHVTAAIQSVRDHYEERGIFMKQFGFGRKPALVVIDMAYGWTDPAYATGSTRLDEAVAGIKQLLPRCRRKQVPIVYTTSPFRQEDEEPMHSRDSSQADGSSYLPWDERACEIDERLKPEPGDFVIYKETPALSLALTSPPTSSTTASTPSSSPAVLPAPACGPRPPTRAPTASGLSYLDSACRTGRRPPTSGTSSISMQSLPMWWTSTRWPSILSSSHERRGSTGGRPLSQRR